MSHLPVSSPGNGSGSGPPPAATNSFPNQSPTSTREGEDTHMSTQSPLTSGPTPTPTIITSESSPFAGHRSLPIPVPSTRPRSTSPLPATRMQYRYLGNSGLKVSAIGLGSWLTYGGQVSPEITYQCIRTAFHLGINYFDTAEIYSNGQCEAVLGMALKKLGCSRSEFVISTKIFWGGNGPNERGLSRKHIIEGLRGSLGRLQLEYVDIVIAHRPDTDTPMEEIVRAFDFVINQGMALYWGTSEWGPQQITHANLVAERLGLIKPIMEQPQYNMLNRDRVEKEYLPLYRDFRLGLVTWSPLLSGVLTGKYLGGIPEGTRLSMPSHVIVNRIRHKLVSAPEGQVIQDKVRRVVAIADQIGCTAAQLAIAWCLRNGRVNAVLMGATNPQQIEENILALTVASRLTGEWDAVLEGVLANKPELAFNYRDA
ncbi:hypothetical protein IWQ61_005624 [Dispira simplex]|nr:hypothetical protein IWQ61_005624 [Dispira simplex]